jgi:hypothetical protein
MLSHHTASAQYTIGHNVNDQGRGYAVQAHPPPVGRLRYLLGTISREALEQMARQHLSAHGFVPNSEWYVCNVAQKGVSFDWRLAFCHFIIF